MATSTRLRRYRPTGYPQIDTDNLGTYLSSNLQRISEAISLLNEVMVLIDTTATPLKSAANDAAAATAGVALQGLYQTSGAVKVRLT